MRRTHRKSRNGCRECKRRHKKCDEMRPICANCLTIQSQCSYADRRPAVYLPLTPASSAVSPVTTVSLLPPPTLTHSSAPTNGLPSEGDGALMFSFMHLQLLHNFEMDLPKSSGMDDSFARTVFKYALKRRYLMDQVLALSALHLSSQTFLDQRSAYRHEATRLQTRALGTFNALYIESKSCGEDILAAFIFSSFLGQHVMFESLLCQDDFDEFVGRFTAYLSVQRGVNAMIGSSWPLIEERLQPIIGSYPHGRDPDPACKGRECDALLELIDNADMGVASAIACREASKSLQWAFDMYRMMSTNADKATTAIAWPTVIPAAFVTMLQQRVPEAMVILAYYAVLLNFSRDFWLFSNGGRFLLGSIVSHLGSYWDPWLVWPKEMMNSDNVGL